MSKALELKLALPTGNLAAYRQAVNSVPMLSADEEKELAERYQATQDLDAAWQLVTSHLRFVVRVARGYSGYGLQEADLIQEGNIGLMKAVKRFDPAVGVRLVGLRLVAVRFVAGRRRFGLRTAMRLVRFVAGRLVAFLGAGARFFGVIRGAGLIEGFGFGVTIGFGRKHRYLR